MILHRFVRAVLLAFCRVYLRETVEGTEHVPSSGPFVLAPVHRSFMDFALVARVTRRRLRYMAKDSLWKVGILGRLLSHMGAFPVHRGAADRDALRRSVEVLEAGEGLVLFPEGTRRSGPAVQQLFEGAAYVACRTGAPIVPVGIGGSERAMRKGQRLPRPVKVHVVVGPPLVPPPSRDGRVSRREVHELTERLHAEVQRLFDRAQSAAGASNTERRSSRKGS